MSYTGIIYMCAWVNPVSPYSSTEEQAVHKYWYIIYDFIQFVQVFVYNNNNNNDVISR